MNSAALSPLPYDALLEENTSLKARLSEALFQVEEFKRLLFGVKSERFIPGGAAVVPMPTLFDPPKPVEAPAKVVEYSVKKEIPKTVPVAKHPGRNPLPAHLPREIIHLEPEGITEGMKCIGEDVTEILDHVPGKLFVRRYVRPKYALAQNQGMVMADLPCQPIEKGMVGAGLLAQIIIDKYVDSLPLYRQIERFKREGMVLKSGTVCGCLEKAAEWLDPVYRVLIKQVLQERYNQIDETTLQVLLKLGYGKTHRGYLWAFHAPLARLIFFDYQPSRGREGPAALLKNFQGYIQTDGYSVYDAFAEMPGIEAVGCMAHARRDFFEAKDNHPEIAEYVLEEMGKLYALEREIKGLEPEAIRKERQAVAVPILQDLEVYMQEQYKKVLPKSRIGKALYYSLVRWKKLMAYTGEGFLQIDNNLIENAIRPIAIGRKNFLFAGSHKGAERAALFFSLLGSCKMNGVEPYAWLKELLQILPSYPANRVHELLPNHPKMIEKYGKKSTPVE